VTTLAIIFTALSAYFENRVKAALAGIASSESAHRYAGNRETFSLQLACELSVLNFDFTGLVSV
jgi:hypothetical protein